MGKPKKIAPVPGGPETVYLGKELRTALLQEVENTGKNKNTIIREVLAKHFKIK